MGNSSELPPPVPPDVLLDTLEISGLPPSADIELLKLYFESKRSGGHDDAVEKCSIVVPGTAHMKFKSQEGKQHTVCTYQKCTMTKIVVMMCFSCMREYC